MARIQKYIAMFDTRERASLKPFTAKRENSDIAIGDTHTGKYPALGPQFAVSFLGHGYATNFSLAKLLGLGKPKAPLLADVL